MEPSTDKNWYCVECRVAIVPGSGYRCADCAATHTDMAVGQAQANMELRRNAKPLTVYSCPVCFWPVAPGRPCSHCGLHIA